MRFLVPMLSCASALLLFCSCKPDYHRADLVLQIRMPDSVAIIDSLYRKRLIDEYRALILSPDLLRKTAARLSNKASAEAASAYRDSILLSGNENALTIIVKVFLSDKENAVQFADTLAEVFQQSLTEQQLESGNRKINAILQKLNLCEQEIKKRDSVIKDLAAGKKEIPKDLLFKMNVIEKEYMYLLQSKTELIVRQAGMLSPVRILERAHYKGQWPIEEMESD
jgi:hypothetical protein